MIKAILLDLGNVLIPFDFKRGYAKMEQICKCPAAEIPQRIGATDLVYRFESGQVEARDFVRQLSAILGIDIGYEQFCEIWSSVFFPDPNIPESMLVSLRQRYRLVLVSNTNAIHFQMLWETYPLLRQFHDLVLSHEVQAMKPLPKIYRAAIEKAGCRPEECFFTDDIPAFVEGARAEGIDAVRFESLAQLERELTERGIEW
jgi:putative hydrolase of the HAD superfamily